MTTTPIPFRDSHAPDNNAGGGKELNILPDIFFTIPIDVEGSNIAVDGWEPTEDNKKHMPIDSWNEARLEYKIKNEKVLFKNTFLSWDSCDCGDGYGCSHGSWVYQINVMNGEIRHALTFQDDDDIIIENTVTKKELLIKKQWTIGDFHRACKLCDIELELTDYALSLFPAPSSPLVVEEMQEQCRLYAESKMPSDWDRRDHIQTGIFYKHYVDKMIEFKSLPSAPVEDKGEKEASGIPEYDKLVDRFKRKELNITQFASLLWNTAYNMGYNGSRDFEIDWGNVFDEWADMGKYVPSPNSMQWETNGLSRSRFIELANKYFK